jgi:hypothetical protein
MDLIADVLLIFASLCAAVYCWTLSARVKRLKNLDSGLGGAIASLSQQVSEMQKALKETQDVTNTNVENLKSSTGRAERVSRRLEAFLDEIEEMGVRDGASATSDARKKVTPKDIEDAMEDVDTDKVRKLDAKREKSSADTTTSAARKLQDSIKSRLEGRADSSDEEAFVRALQTVLAQANAT